MKCNNNGKVELESILKQMPFAIQNKKSQRMAVFVWSFQHHKKKNEWKKVCNVFHVSRAVCMFYFKLLQCIMFMNSIEFTLSFFFRKKNSSAVDVCERESTTVCVCIPLIEYLWTIEIAAVRKTVILMLNAMKTALRHRFVHFFRSRSLSILVFLFFPPTRN